MRLIGALPAQPNAIPYYSLADTGTTVLPRGDDEGFQLRTEAWARLKSPQRRWSRLVRFLDGACTRCHDTVSTNGREYGDHWLPRPPPLDHGTGWSTSGAHRAARYAARNRTFSPEAKTRKTGANVGPPGKSARCGSARETTRDGDGVAIASIRSPWQCQIFRSSKDMRRPRTCARSSVPKESIDLGDGIGDVQRLLGKWSI